MALTIEQFGESVKQKYPQYKDIDSATLGQKMLDKYPEYQSKVQQAPTSAILGTPNKVEPNLSPLKNAAGVVGAGLGTAAGGLAGAYTLGGAMKTAGKALYSANLPPVADEARAIQSYKAGVSKTKPRTTIDTMLDLPMIQKTEGGITSKPGGFGTRSMIGDQTQAAANNIFKKTIEPIFKKADEAKISFDFKKLQKQAIEKAKNSRLYSNELKKDIVGDITELFADMKGKTSLKNLDQLKKEIVKKIPQKYLKTGAGPTPYSLQSARDFVSSTFRDTVHDTIKNKFDVNSAKLYGDYANLKGVSEIGVKAKTQAGRKGGSGTFISWITDTLSTPVTTTAGKAGYKLGEAMQYIPKKAVKGLKIVGKGAKNLVKGLAVIDPLGTPELLQYMPGTIGESFKEYIKTNPGSIALQKMMEMGKSKEQVAKEVAEELNISKEEVMEILEGKKIII